MIDRTEGAVEALSWALLTLERLHVTGKANAEIQGAINDLLRGSATDFRLRVRIHA